MSEWISLKVRAPEIEGKEYLVYGKCTNSYYEVDIAYFWKGEFEKTNQPSHWAPLPEPPKD